MPLQMSDSCRPDLEYLNENLLGNSPVEHREVLERPEDVAELDLDVGKLPVPVVAIDNRLSWQTVNRSEGRARGEGRPPYGPHCLSTHFFLPQAMPTLMEIVHQWTKKQAVGSDTHRHKYIYAQGRHGRTSSPNLMSRA